MPISAFQSVSKAMTRGLMGVAFVGTLALWCVPCEVLAGDKPITYPKTRKVDQVDDFHGTKVADPYRWLEDDNSPETAKWVEAQNKVTFGYLEQIPERNRIKKRLTDIWNYERFTRPYKRGGRYFYRKNDGLQNQSVLYTMKSLTGKPEMLLDPNTLSDDGTVALGGYDVSENGKFLVYSLQISGSDWREVHVRDIETGKDLPDVVKWVKFSNLAWTHDNKGFFYCRYDEPKGDEALKALNYFHKLYYHELGTPQSKDELIYERKDHKDWNFTGQVTEDGRFLVISVGKGTERQNLVFYKDLAAKDSPVVELIRMFEGKFDLVGNDGTVLYFVTDVLALRSQIMSVDLNQPERENWKVIVPEVTATLRGASLVGDKIIAKYLNDAHSQIAIFTREGRYVRGVDLPEIGSARGFYGRPGENETFYTFESFTAPPTIYRYDTDTGESTIFRQPKVDINPGDYQTVQVFYESKDGTRVPMFIVSKKDMVRDGSNPTFLYGYGGFDIPIVPGFSVKKMAWLEMGGIYVVANIRGGGEYGKEWHYGGKKLTKQNSFDDFIAAAETLIANKYTSPSKLSIGGASNGGLLVGACMVQRPDLFAAALPAVGVMDMLRFHKFTIGWAWTSDYGSPDNADEFKVLYSYSPLHNLKAGTAYPATLVTTADHDDRVFPAHSFKFAAALQEAQSGPAPTLIRIETKAGHGSGKPTSKQIEEAADCWTFLLKNLDMKIQADW